MVLEITGGNSVIFENETYVVCKESTTLSITGSGTVNYLIIGGGGGGGISHGGGGGAGEVISGVFNATPGNYRAEVGLGGSIYEYIGGSSSILNKTPTAIGGGRGGGAITGIASGGGSGGGGSGYVSSEIGGSSTISNVGGIGNAGGNGFKVSNFAGGGGGGGGSGSSGKTPLTGLSSNSPGAVGGSGITGYSSWINAIKSLMSLDWKTATSTGVIASGGSGGSWGTGTFITGPPGGGGNGGDKNFGTIVIPPTSGINNTGSGGGGGGSGNQLGASGGSGLIILKYGTNKFSISPNTLSVITNNYYSSLYTLNATNVGSYSISPAASSGLNFNTVTGILSGTLNNNASNTTYTITATYTDLTTSIQQFSLTILNSFTVTPSTFSATIGTTYTNFYSVSSGNVVSYSISPSLSSGLTFNTSTGILSGTLNNNNEISKIYTITATYKDLTTSIQQFTLAIANTFIMPRYYSGNAGGNAFVGRTYTNLNTITSGNVQSYSISPSISTYGSESTGLTFNTSTGIISGTPTINYGNTYNIVATYKDLTTKLQYFSVIIKNPNSFILTPITSTALVGTTYTKFYNYTITNNLSFSISPSPSASSGLTFNTDSGFLSGTPTTRGTTTYTITLLHNSDSTTTSQEFTLTVINPNSFNLTSSTSTAFVGSTYTDFYNLTSDNVETYSISPDAPSGLTFNTSTGILSGTPTTLSTTPYTITATYTDLTTSVQQFTLTVRNPNSFNLNTNAYTATIGLSHTDFYNLTSDNIQSFSIIPSPPQGLTFNTATGIISGTPTTLGTTPYTITATYLDLTTSIQYFTLSVKNPNSFNLTPITSTAFIGSSYTNFYSLTSDNVETFSINPSPSGGLIFNTSTGILSGSPTIRSTTTYTITATNTDITTNVQQFTLTTINPNSFNLTKSAFNATIGTTYYQFYSFTSDNVVSYSISPSPSKGLTFNTSTCIFGGTPTTLGITPYIITAKYTDLTTSTQQFTVSVRNPNSFTLNPKFFPGYAFIGTTYTNFYSITSVNVQSYSIDPSPPPGTTFNTSTGILSGTPTTKVLESYTITATYEDLKTKIQYFYITVKNPNSFNLDTNAYTATIGLSHTDFYNLTSDNIQSFSIIPSPPQGLTFNTATGIISGTPTTLGTTPYTITATYLDLTTSIQYFTLSVKNPNSFNLTPITSTAFIGSSYTNFYSLTSDNVETFSINPSPSGGLTFDTATGILSGSPTIRSTTTYTITATNTDITTNVQQFTLTTINPNSFNLTKSAFNATIGTTYYQFYSFTSDNVVSYSISPSPSPGLTFDTATGILSGTPTTLGITPYTITASFIDLTASTRQFTLTVSNPNSFNLNTNAYTTTIGLLQDDFYSFTSDNVVSYSISPSPSPGLTFDTATGILSGTPTTLGITPYTITAAYIDLTASTRQFTLTVSNPNSFNLTPITSTAFIGSSYTNFYSLTSDNVVSYSISPYSLDGLTFNTSTGILSGSPTIRSTTTYTITATYIDLTTSIQYFTLTVKNRNKFNLTSTAYTALVGITYTKFYSFTSDNVETYSISPSLSESSGLTFDTVTGIFGGTPTTLSTTTYTITATYTDLTTNVKQFTLTVKNPNSFTMARYYAGHEFGEIFRGTTYTNLNIITSNDNVVSYSISPSISTYTSSISTDGSETESTGLTFNTSTGIISGTPTINYSGSTYRITATFTDLSTKNQYFTVIAIRPNSFNLTQTVYTAFVGSTYTEFYGLSSDNVKTYSISPSPPEGLTFSPAGYLTGTPTTLGTTTYTITALYNSDSTTSTQQFTLTVINPNSFNLTPITSTGFIGSTYTDFYSLTSDNVETYSISPSPSPGLTFDTTTGIISGTPTTRNTTPYSITATYTDLTTSVQQFTLTVKNPNSFNLTPNTSTALVGTTYTDFYSLTSDNVETFSISPSLSSGLTFNTSTGILNGSPTTLGITHYTITATYTDLTTSTKQFTLIVKNPNSFNLTQTVYNAFVGSTYTEFYGLSSDNVETYSISPSPPQGLIFNTSTGILSGTPTTLGARPYYIMATFTDLTTNIREFVLTVRNPNSFNLTPITSTAFIGSIYTNLNTITSDNVETYSISPSPPQGLTFNTSTGILSGTPTTRSTTTYNITATYTDLTTSIQQFTLTVINPNRFNLTTSAFSATIGSTYTEFYGLSSDNVETYSISPSLSETSGLTFNTSTGILSGTPTTLSSTPYTITATYTDLTTSIQELTLTVKNPNSFNLTTSTSTAFIGSTYTEFYGLSSDNVESYFISPSLSETSGLTFNTSTCILSGTPTTLGTTTYTITATYTDLTTSIQELTLTVRNPNSFNLTTSTSTAFVGSTYTEFYGLSSDNVETFAISPSPSGELIFNTSTGILSGTPTTISTTPYSITATYTDLTTSVQQFTLTVKNPNSFNLTPSAYTALVGSTYTEFYGLTSDNVETFSISPSPSPSGELTFDTATGILSGTPTTISTTPYTITATYTDLTTSVQQFTLTVKKPNKFNLTTNTSTATIGLSQTYFYSFTSDNVEFYSISPSPSPSGELTFDTATGILSGTLTTLGTTTYTITATFIDLTTSIQELTLTVINPNSFNLTPSAFSAFIGSTYTELYSLSSENVVSYSISPSPSASSGLIFNQATGILSGSPTTRDTTPYTITATYIDLTTSIQYFTLTVKNRNKFNLTSTAYTAFIGTTYTDFYSLTSDNVETFSISPSLSASSGLIFNPATGILSGTPNTPITTAYSITATYADLTTSVEQFTLTVKNPNSFNITPSAFSATIGSSYTNFYSFTSDNVQSYSIDPIPSSGLIFNTATGILRGTPDTIGTTTYTITVNYDDGSTSSQTYELTIEATCFLKGSKILTDKGYIAIENLRKGDLVKTFLNNYKAILMIGKNIINHNANKNRIKDQLYKYSKGVYPELTDDLIISGGHSILVNDFETEEQKSANIKYFGEELPKVDGLYKLLTYVNEKSFPYNEKGDFEIYHLSLENKEIDKEYGIYANGLLVESCSIIDFIKYSGLKLIE